ncbi:hypothetical protein [Bacillus kwashiorkori]|uniref:hypothetical protein n=1 Tax=Bacillus kwashiorkori TaxID=1522318 RepID=UPI001319E2CD|nr:hypothetical protein [Bacillus kwashiorkori]
MDASRQLVDDSRLSRSWLWFYHYAPASSSFFRGDGGFGATRRIFKDASLVTTPALYFMLFIWGD